MQAAQEAMVAWRHLAVEGKKPKEIRKLIEEGIIQKFGPMLGQERRKEILDMIEDMMTVRR